MTRNDNHVHVFAPTPLPLRTSQRGATLLELMVGITIGLLTVAVALGALMVSRGVSGTMTKPANTTTSQLRLF